MERDLRAIGWSAVVYGLPTVRLHRILVNLALDRLSPEFNAPLNAFAHARAPADPNDPSIAAMNVDTPYSYAWLDLRTEPIVLTVPPHEPERDVSIELVDLYTYVVGDVSLRTNGSAGGQFLVTGPGWSGDAAVGVGVFACPTELALVLVRTHVLDDADLANVIALQDQMGVQALSAWSGRPGPREVTTPPVPDLATVDVRAPLDGHFLHVLDVMLALMPLLPGDERVREELAGVGVGGPGLAELLDDPQAHAELVSGLAEGLADVRARCASVRSAAELVGSREHFAGDHLARAAGAYLGILGGSAMRDCSSSVQLGDAGPT